MSNQIHNKLCYATNKKNIYEKYINLITNITLLIFKQAPKYYVLFLYFPVILKLFYILIISRYRPYKCTLILINLK